MKNGDFQWLWKRLPEGNVSYYGQWSLLLPAIVTYIVIVIHDIMIDYILVFDEDYTMGQDGKPIWLLVRSMSFVFLFSTYWEFHNPN